MGPLHPWIRVRKGGGGRGVNLVPRVFSLAWEKTLGTRLRGGGGGNPDPALPLLFHENPASRTFFMTFPNPVFLFEKKKYIKSNFYKSLLM